MLPEKLMGHADCRDLVQCAFNLNDFEIEVYRKLLEIGPSRADTLGEALKKDRSTVYRALQKLLSCGLAYRETRVLERGGYFHVYIPLSKNLLKEKLQECISNWQAQMKNLLAKFDEDF